MLQQGHFEARRLIAGVRPPILDELGVVMAVSHLVHEQNSLKGPKVEYRSGVVSAGSFPPWKMPSTVSPTKVANACQHSKSEKVRVSLLQQKDRFPIKFVIGASALTRRQFGKTISAWRASGSGPGFWAENSPFEARPATAHGSPLFAGSVEGLNCLPIAPAEFVAELEKGDDFAGANQPYSGRM